MATSALNSILDPIDFDESVDWSHVRAVYRKLHTDFHVLTRPFGIQISNQRDRDLAHLIGAIDVVDRELDEIELAADRQLFGQSILDYLRGKTAEIAYERSTEELIFRLRVLRNLIVRREIQSSFCDTVQQILEHTEAKRQTIDPRQMIRHLTAEWRATGHLTVLVLGGQSTPAFERFFYLACEMMHSIDTMQDVRSDYRKRQVKVRPTIGLYARLIAEFVFPLPKLLFRFPARWDLFKYACSFLMLGIAERGQPVQSTRNS